MTLPKFKLPRVKLPRPVVHPDMALLVIFLVGLVSACIGLYMIYPPLAPIAAGVVLMGVTLIGDRKTQ